MGLQRWGFCQGPKFEGSISHSLLSPLNLAIASTSHFWSFHNHFLTTKSNVSLHLMSFFRMLYLPLDSKRVFSLLSVLHWFLFLNPSFQCRHLLNCYPLSYSHFTLFLEDLVLVHDPVIFIEMILKPTSLAWTSFLKLRAIFPNFSRQIQLIVMEALLGSVLATSTHITQFILIFTSSTPKLKSIFFFSLYFFPVNSLALFGQVFRRDSQ